MGGRGRSVVTGKILIRRPAGEVFGVVADERNEPSYGTRMRWWWSLEPHGPLRLATPVLARLGGRLERRIWEGLKRLMEAGGPTGAGL